MQLRRVLLLLTVLFLAPNLTAQSNEKLVSINFEGLAKTQISFVQEIIQSRKGREISVEKIEADVQNLKNLSGIGHVTYSLDTLSNGLDLVFHVEEVKTLLPIVNFGTITDNFWFKLGFVDINWQGKGQAFSVYYQNNDQRHSGQIYYRVPNFKNKAWGYTASITKWASIEPLFFTEETVLYDYDNNSIALTGLRQFGLRHSIELGGTFFIETYNKNENQELQFSPGPSFLKQNKILTKFLYQSNNLDYHFFYLKGNTWRAIVQNVYTQDEKSVFNSLRIQGKQFFRVKEKINLAFRLNFAISTNNDSPFAPFVADSHVNLRGVGNRIDRGTAQAVINAEYRHTIYHSNKWAAQVVAFADIGSWRDPGGQLKDIFEKEEIREFVGGGVRIIYKKVYGAVLRIDYGVDIFNSDQRGLVLGLGQYF